MYAIVPFHRSLPAVKFSLECDADVNSKGNVWKNAFQLAVTNGDHELIELLIRHGGNVNTSSILGGSSPLMAAVSTRHKSTVQFLLTRGAHMHGRQGIASDILQTARYLGWKDVVVELLNRGADVNARLDLWGSLMLALQGRYPDVA